MPLGSPVVPPEKRIAAGSSVLAGTGSVLGAPAASIALHQRTRASAATFGILRPLVSAKPMRFNTGR